MAAGSNAHWFRVIKIGTVDSKTFSIFLCLIEKIVTETNSTNSWKPVIIPDNVKVHTSNYTKTVKSSLKLEVSPLPPYCPEVAPIEHLFKAIKAKLRSRILSGPSTLVSKQELKHWKMQCWLLARRFLRGVNWGYQRVIGRNMVDGHGAQQ